MIKHNIFVNILIVICRKRTRAASADDRPRSRGLPHGIGHSHPIGVAGVRHQVFGLIDVQQTILSRSAVYPLPVLLVLGDVSLVFIENTINGKSKHKTTNVTICIVLSWAPRSYT